MEQHAYGWLPQPHDDRDRQFKLATAPKELPAKVDLSDQCGPVLNQGSIGSCTAHAIAVAVWQAKVRASKTPFIPSRLFVYYHERVAINQVNEDSGAYLRDGFKVINKLGAPDERHWPYVVHRWADKPVVDAYKDGLKNQAIKYYRLYGTVYQVKEALAAGYPVVFGFKVFASFSRIRKSRPTMPMPNPDGEELKGGHAVIAVGYSNRRKAFLIRNSWGELWGDGGYFWMPYAFFELSEGANVADFWVLEVIE